MTDYPRTQIDLLRHGEPQGGVKFRGATDDPLSATGWAQMRGAIGDANGWDQLITSPLRRCAEFAAELSARHSLPLESEARFQEIGFGAWEGLSTAEVSQMAPDALANFWRDPLHHAPSGGENLLAFEARVAAGWRDLLTRHAGKKILLVCHGGVIRLIVSQVLGMPLHNLFRMEVPYAALARIRVDGAGEDALPQLVSLGGSLRP